MLALDPEKRIDPDGGAAPPLHQATRPQEEVPGAAGAGAEGKRVTTGERSSLSVPTSQYLVWSRMVCFAC